MDFNTIETPSFIKNLKCSICNNYLSYFPIFLTNNKLNICGRCEIPKDSENSDEVVPHIRNEVYEIAAQEFIFPCRYVDEGCTEKLQSEDVPEHEYSCPLRLVKCPVSLLDLCDKVMSLSEVGSHCKEAHAELILKDEKFEIDLLKYKRWKNLLMVDDRCFIFNATFESGSNNLSCTLTCSDFDQRLMETYKLSLTSDSTSVVKNFSICNHASLHFNINLNIFEELGSTTLIKCELLRLSEEKVIPHNDDIRTLVEKMFKCNVCHKHLKPPTQVYFQNKKIVCDSCKSYNCSLLSIDIVDSLAEKLLFPCKYQPEGCSQTLCPSKLKSHESLCPFRTTSCPLTCQWTGLAKETVSHISTKHPKEIATSFYFCVPFRDVLGNINVTKTYILKYSCHFFRLTFSFQKNLCRWSLQIIGDVCDDFFYEIEIGSNPHRLVIVKKCTLLIDEKPFQSNNNFCYLMVDQFEDIIPIKYNMNFKVRIFK